MTNDDALMTKRMSKSEFAKDEQLMLAGPKFRQVLECSAAVLCRFGIIEQSSEKRQRTAALQNLAGSSHGSWKLSGLGLSHSFRH